MANVIGEKLNEVTQMINEFSNVKDDIRLGIRPVTADEQVDVVTSPYLDLELYCYVQLGGGMSTKVTKGLLEMWGVNKDKLFWIATDNTVPTYTMQTMLLYSCCGRGKRTVSAGYV